MGTTNFKFRVSLHLHTNVYDQIQRKETNGCFEAAGKSGRVLEKGVKQAIKGI